MIARRVLPGVREVEMVEVSLSAPADLVDRVVAVVRREREEDTARMLPLGSLLLTLVRRNRPCLRGAS